MTSAQSTSATVVAAISHVSGTEAGSAATEARLTDLGISSLLLFAFVSELEMRAGLSIPDDRLRPETFSTVGSVCRLIDELRAG